MLFGLGSRMVSYDRALLLLCSGGNKVERTREPSEETSGYTHSQRESELVASNSAADGLKQLDVPGVFVTKEYSAQRDPRIERFIHTTPYKRM